MSIIKFLSCPKRTFFLTFPVFLMILLFAMCTEGNENKKKIIVIESISINGGDQPLFLNSTVPMTAAILPENASNKEIEWSSDDEDVVIINNYGQATALSLGTAYITAAAKDDSGKSDTIAVSVIYAFSDNTEKPFRWTFQEKIPGWTNYSDGYKEMSTDSSYLNNMTLLGSNNKMRWLYGQTTSASGFSSSCIQTSAGSDNAFLRIDNVHGPFNIKFNYTNAVPSGTGTRYPVLHINGNKVKQGPLAATSNGTNAARILDYNYFQNDIVTVQLTSVGSFHLYDVILSDSLGIPVSNIIVNGDSDFSLKAGEMKQLTLSVIPDDAADKNVIWSSSDISVVTVNQTGLVTGVNTGNAVITAMSTDSSGVSGSVAVTLAFIPISNITITGGNFSLVEGNTKNLETVISPGDASNKIINWTSGNKSVVEVSVAGIVKAIAPGQTVITAAADDDSGKYDAVTVTVTASGGEMTPLEIFNSLKGQKVTTFGWADMANNGAGLSYANPANLTLIDDAAYPTAQAKYDAFINANFTSRPTIASNGVFSGGTINDDAKFIIISGDIDLSNGRINDNDKSFYEQFNSASPYARVNGDIILNLGSNTTIIGINNARIKFGGIRINNKSNVIIRNITFWDAHGSTANDTTKSGYSESKAGIDALVIQGTSNGVWVDHCLFTNGTCNDMIRNYNHDGALDIPRGKNVTVSWTEFTNYDKVMLVAGSDSADNAIAEDRQITLHHNYFHYTTQRMPRTRGTQMHVYNNYYNNIGVEGNNGSFMGPGWGAQFIVENNFFGSKRGDKNIEWFDTNPSLYPVKFYYSGNNHTSSSFWLRASDPKPWIPAYVYPLDNNADLPDMIPSRAGPSLVFNK